VIGLEGVVSVSSSVLCDTVSCDIHMHGAGLPIRSVARECWNGAPLLS